MPIYSVQGPDGRIYDVEGPAGASNADIIAAVKRDIAARAAAEPKKKEGVLASAQKGVESMISSGQTALESLLGSPEEAARRGLQRGEAISRRFADEVSLERVKKAYEERGLLPAAGEALRQVPSAIAEQAPNIGATLGSARLGAMAGSTFGPVGTLVGGVAGAALPSLITQFGGNIERQAAEQQKRGEPIQIERGAAGAAAVPQAALDVVGTFVPLGGQLVSKLTGIPVNALLGRSAAQVTKLAEERLLATLAKGTAVGAVAEIPTEVIQQMLERAQAGLPLTTPDAFKEYGETAYQVGLLAPLGGLGRLSERAGARGKVLKKNAEEQRAAQEAELKQQAEAQRKAAAEAAAEEKRKQTPEYAIQFGQQYDALQKQFFDLKSQLKKPGANATFEEKEQYKEQQTQLKDLAKKLTEKTPEYRRIKSVYQEELDRLKKQQDQADEQRMLAMEQEGAKTQAAQVEPYFEGPQQTLFGFEGEPAPTTVETEVPDYARQARLLSAQLDDIRARAQTTTNLDEKIKLGQEYAQVEKAFKEASEAAKKTAEPTQDRQIALLRKKMAVAEEEGDVATQVKLAQQLKNLGVTDLTATPEQGEFPLAPFKPTVESKEAFAARVYKPGAADIEAQETALREEQDRADEVARQETLRNQKLAPEVAALKRIAGRPAGVDTNVRAALPLEPAVPTGSAAMGQMQQQLRGVPLGEEPIYTAAEPSALAQPKRVPGEGFRLFNRQNEPVRPSDYNNLSQRLASALARSDLSNEAYDFLRRAEQVLPQMDYSLSEERIASNKAGVFRDVASTRGLLTLLDKQLSLIESGAEGRMRKGARRAVEYQRFPAGEVAVTKRTTEITPTTLRGPSAQPLALSLQPEMEPLVQSLERAQQDIVGIQQGLFPEEEKKLGAIKTDRAAFVRFMNSPFVRTLRKNLTKAVDDMRKAEKDLPPLRAKIATLTQQILTLQKAQQEYKNAAAVLKEKNDLVKTTENVATINAALTDMFTARMETVGKVQELEAELGQLQNEAAKWGTWGETASVSFVTDLRNKLQELRNYQQDLASLEADMQRVNQTLRVLKAQNTINGLRDAAPFPIEVEQAVSELRAAQAEAGVIESAANKARIEQIQQAAEKRRQDAAVDKAARERARVEQTKAEQRRLEAMYGEEATGLQYPAITEAQRFAREGIAPKMTPESVVPEGKDPQQVLGGVRAYITRLEKIMRRAQQRSSNARNAELTPLEQNVKSLEARLRAETNATKRDALIVDIEAAADAYQAAATKLAAEPLTWKGMKGQIRALADAYAREEIIERGINQGTLATLEERAPRTAMVRPSAGEKAATAEVRATEESTEAAKRAAAPATSGEALTRTEAAKEQKPKKTLYSSKGVGEEIQQRIAEKVRNKTTLERMKKEKGNETLQQAAATAAQGPKLKEKILPEEGIAPVMNNLSTSGSDAITRAIAQRLKLLLGPTRLELVDDLKMPDGTAAYGSATVDGMLVRLDSKYGLNEQTVIHEGVHAATERVMRMPEDQLTPDQLAAKRELEELYKAYMADKNAPNANAKTNVSEFLSEALSDAELKVYLESKPWTLKNMWKAVKNGILKLLGVETPKNMLEVTLAAADRLMVRPVRATSADMQIAIPALPRPRTVNPALEKAVETTNKIVAQNQSNWQKIKAHGTGLEFETMLVDRFAGFERAAKLMPQQKGLQMVYYLRMYDQRMNFVSQSVGNGALQRVAVKRPDGGTEYLIESVEGPSVKSVANILKDATPLVGDANAVNRLFTLYMSAKRADKVGFNRLNFDGQVTEAELRSAIADISNVAGLGTVFERARTEYNKYNQNQIRFLEQTGAIGKDLADQLAQENDYIPWYRQRQDGVVEMVLGKEGTFAVGNVREQPYLQELVGDNKPILDFLTSSVQNTNMLVDMGLRNIATKNAVFELLDIGAAKIVGKTSGPDVVKFNDNGKEHYAIIQTQLVDQDLPGHLLVKGMEGIPMQATGLLKMGSVPARLLRKFVTLNPLYPARQLFRDSLAAPILAGADFAPVAGALKEIGSVAQKKLEKRGIVGGQYFTGTQEDLSMILRDVMDGKTGIGTLISKAEAFGMEADALTRRAQYNSYIKQGLSEMEATLMALESMNFNKRGASPTIHMLNSLIPFFNAQIQSLNVVYKALRGQMPLNDRLRIREKLLTRGFMLMAVSLAYAAMMSDDEAYKNASPDQKYGNWFIRLPGVDEPLKLPIPFEVGYIFKALPEALFNYIKNGDSKDAKEALQMILRQVIPGGSSMPLVEVGGMRVPVPVPIPQGAKPLIELALNKSFYTGRDLVSAKEQRLLPEAQYRENTTELSKMFGSSVGVSPIKLDALINGYLSTLGIATLHLLGAGISTQDSPEKAAKRLSDMPIVGGAFQPNDAAWIINSTYDLFKEDMQVAKTVQDYISKGERAKAMELLQTRSAALAQADLGKHYETAMTKFTQYETAIRASNKTPEEKQKMLEQVRQYKIKFSAMVKEASEKTRSQQTRP